MKLGYYDLEHLIEGRLPETKSKVEEVIPHQRYIHTHDSEGRLEKHGNTLQYYNKQGESHNNP